jgi:hypothetical protein
MRRLIEGMPLVDPTTQKAKGVEALQSWWGGVPTAYLFTPAVVEWFLEEAKRRRAAQVKIKAAPHQWFARPCPPEAVHGYLESRPIKNFSDLLRLCKRVFAYDPRAEVLLMPLIEAKWNAILTPSNYTIGPGRDGATSGRDAEVLPMVRVEPGKWDDYAGQVIQQSRIDLSQHDPFVEYVFEHSSSPQIVQMRAGNKQVAVGPDFVPQAMVVERVVEATGDLIQFAALLDELKGLDGVVVAHAGGALTSHYGVHATSRNIAILTTGTPEVGEQLEATPDLPAYDHQALIRGMDVGMALRQEDWKHGQIFHPMLMSGLFGLHHAVALRGPASFYVGLAAACLVRLGTLAAAGEDRHKLALKGKETGSRDALYRQGLKTPWYLRRQLPVFMQHFCTLNWIGGVGGLNWAFCTRATIRLDHAMVSMAQEPSDQHREELISYMNELVNLSHNNGWWLNKFGPHEWFDYVQQGKKSVLEKLGPFLYQVKRDVGVVRHWSQAKRVGHDGQVSVQTNRYCWRLVPIDAGVLVQFQFSPIHRSSTMMMSYMPEVGARLKAWVERQEHWLGGLGQLSRAKADVPDKVEVVGEQVKVWWSGEMIWSGVLQPPTEAAVAVGCQLSRETRYVVHAKCQSSAVVRDGMTMPCPHTHLPIGARKRHPNDELIIYCPSCWEERFGLKEKESE